MLASKKAEAKFFFTDESTGERFDLFDERVVGRTQGDFQFPQDPRMSGKHGKFIVDDGGVRVEDIGSRNGILVNGKKIAAGAPTRVLPGDMVEMGNHTFCIGRGGDVPIGSISKVREETSTEVLTRAPDGHLKPVRSPAETPGKPKPVKAPGPAPVMNLEDFSSPIHEPTKKPKSGPPKETAPSDGPQVEEIATEPSRFEADHSSSAHPAVLGMLAAFSALFLAMTATGVHPVRPMFMDVVRWGANYGPETTHGEWWRLISSAFIHAGLVQLVASCVAFWQVANILVGRLGAAGVLAAFFSAQAAGALTFVALQPDQAGYGAMHGVVGLFGALAVMFLRDRATLDSSTRSALWAAAAVLFAANLGTSLRGVADTPGLALAFAMGGVIEGAMRALRPAVAITAVLAPILLIANTIPPVQDHAKDARAVVEAFLPIAERYDRIRARAKAGQASPLEMVTTINNDFLPAVRGLRERLEKLPKLDDERQSAVESLKASFAAWERAWALQAQGLAANDSLLLKDARELEAAGFNHLEASARTLERWKMRPARY